MGGDCKESPMCGGGTGVGREAAGLRVREPGCWSGLPALGSR